MTACPCRPDARWCYRHRASDSWLVACGRCGVAVARFYGTSAEADAREYLAGHRLRLAARRALDLMALRGREGTLTPEEQGAWHDLTAALGGAS